MAQVQIHLIISSGRKVRLRAQVVEGGHAHTRNWSAYHRDMPHGCYRTMSDNTPISIPHISGLIDNLGVYVRRWKTTSHLH
jgi:hypothetical protein